MFCAHEPEEGAGGETALAKIDEVTRNLDPRVLEMFRKKQVRYIGRLPDENMQNKRAQPWQDRFLTKERKASYGRATGSSYKPAGRFLFV